MHPFADYNDYILKNSEVTDTLCTSCNNQALLKYIKIKDVEPEILLVVFECSTCNIKESTIFNENSKCSKLIIECYFSDLEDLKREVNLNMHALLFINYKDVKYEHESSLPLVSTVEGIIDQAIISLKNNEIIKESSNNSDSTLEMQNAVDKLSQIKDNPVFYMRIEDNEGSSRVGLVNRGVYEMQNNNLEDFNDSKVTHMIN